MGKDQYSGVSRKQKAVIKNSGRCHTVHGEESYVIMNKKAVYPGKACGEMYEYIEKKREERKPHINSHYSAVIQWMKIGGAEYRSENVLFAAAAKWLKSKGMSKIDSQLGKIVKEIFDDGEDLESETVFHNIIARRLKREDLVEEEEKESARMSEDTEAAEESGVPEEADEEEPLMWGRLQICGTIYPANMVFKRYSGPVLTLYRSMSADEYAGLCSTAGSRGKPVFTFKTGRKGGEKYFAPNIRYLTEGSEPGHKSMQEKGEREITVKILLLPSVTGALIYNPKYSGFALDSEERFMREAGMRPVRKGSGHQIVIKRESPPGSKARSASSLNVGFKTAGALRLLADYIVSIHVIEPEMIKQGEAAAELPLSPVLEEDEMAYWEELPMAQVEGDIFAMEGRSYDVGSNQVENGECLWSLLLEAGIPGYVLEAAAQEQNIRFMDYVDTAELGPLVEEVNRRLPEGSRIRIFLDAFYYDGHYDTKESGLYGSEGTILYIGGIFAPDGLGHYVMRER